MAGNPAGTGPDSELLASRMACIFWTVEAGLYHTLGSVVSTLLRRSMVMSVGWLASEAGSSPVMALLRAIKCMRVEGLPSVDGRGPERRLSVKLSMKMLDRLPMEAGTEPVSWLEGAVNHASEVLGANTSGMEPLSLLKPARVVYKLLSTQVSTRTKADVLELAGAVEDAGGDLSGDAVVVQVERHQRRLCKRAYGAVVGHGALDAVVVDHDQGLQVAVA